MDSIRVLRNLAISVGVMLVGFALGAQQPQARPHSGYVEDVSTGRPMVVDIKAWPASREAAKQGNCPIFGEFPLDSVRSGEDGIFQLKVDSVRPTYTVTYCVADYYPRVDRDIPNESPAVIPKPVFVYPRRASQNAYGSFVRREIVGALNNLAYLQSINPKAFNDALASLGKQTANFQFESLPMVVGEWSYVSYRPNR
jgi:hypothetical protein